MHAVANPHTSYTHRGNHRPRHRPHTASASLHVGDATPLPTPPAAGAAPRPSDSAASRLRSVHESAAPSPIAGGTYATVRGAYDYYHYAQDGTNDRGWGCAYRSLQTIWSWYCHRHCTDTPPPSHRCAETSQSTPPPFLFPTPSTTPNQFGLLPGCIHIRTRIGWVYTLVCRGRGRGQGCWLYFLLLESQVEQKQIHAGGSSMHAHWFKMGVVAAGRQGSSAVCKCDRQNLLAVSEQGCDNSGKPGPHAKGVNHLETPSDNCS